MTAGELKPGEVFMTDDKYPELSLPKRLVGHKNGVSLFMVCIEHAVCEISSDTKVFSMTINRDEE